MNLLVRLALLSLACGAFAQSPDPLAEINPWGRQALSAADYVRYAPLAKTLAGKFTAVYSGTSELWFDAIRAHLGRAYPNVDWQGGALFTSSAGVHSYLLEEPGIARVGICSWPLTSAQREEFQRKTGHPLLEAKVAVDALQVMVHRDNPLPGITIPQLDAMYGTGLKAGAMKPIGNWDDVQPGSPLAGSAVHPFRTVEQYGTSRFFQDAVLMGGPWRREIPILGDVEQSTELRVGADPAGISFSNFRPRGDGVRVIPVARQTGEPAYPPLPSHIYSEEYPLTRFFYVYATAADIDSLSAPDREFLNYLLSFEGQYEVAKSGSLPLDVSLIQRARKRLGLPLSAGAEESP